MTTTNTPIRFPNSNYNYYPNSAIALCVTSYNHINDIKNNVKAIQWNNANANLEVVWGPAQLTDILGISYSLMYIVKNIITQEYFVVIRGTNPISMESWLKEDFSVSTTQPICNLPNIIPGFPEHITISQGAFTGVSDLLSLTDPITGYSALKFLQEENPAYLYVTGHSLGGTLTPVLYTYLNWMLYDGVKVSNMALWSFAGLTAGGNDFNTYLNGIINTYIDNNVPTALAWRIANSLDIAPFLFYSQNSIINIYAFYLPNTIKCPLDVLIVLGILFDEASKAGTDFYEQPQGGISIQGDLEKGLSWISEAMLQHHSTTYQSLVSSIYV
jgi:Lipase (class 3)